MKEMKMFLLSLFLVVVDLQQFISLSQSQIILEDEGNLTRASVNISVNGTEKVYFIIPEDAFLLRETIEFKILRQTLFTSNESYLGLCVIQNATSCNPGYAGHYFYYWYEYLTSPGPITVCVSAIKGRNEAATVIDFYIQWCYDFCSYICDWDCSAQGVCDVENTTCTCDPWLGNDITSECYIDYDYSDESYYDPESNWSGIIILIVFLCIILPIIVITSITVVIYCACKQAKKIQQQQRYQNNSLAPNVVLNNNPQQQIEMVVLPETQLQQQSISQQSGNEPNAFSPPQQQQQPIIQQPQTTTQQNQNQEQNQAIITPTLYNYSIVH